MPFFFNIKALIGIVFTLAILFSVIFFFAFFAIISLPLILFLYLFRKKILQYFLNKSFFYASYNTNKANDSNNTYKNNKKDYIEVDYADTYSVSRGIMTSEELNYSFNVISRPYYNYEIILSTVITLLTLFFTCAFAYLVWKYVPLDYLYLPLFAVFLLLII